MKKARKLSEMTVPEFVDLMRELLAEYHGPTPNDEDDEDDTEWVGYVIVNWGQAAEPMYYAGVGHQGKDLWSDKLNKALVTESEDEFETVVSGIRWFPERGAVEVYEVRASDGDGECKYKLGNKVWDDEPKKPMKGKL